MPRETSECDEAAIDRMATARLLALELVDGPDRHLGEARVVEGAAELPTWPL